MCECLLIAAHDGCEVSRRLVARADDAHRCIGLPFNTVLVAIRSLSASLPASAGTVGQSHCGSAASVVSPQHKRATQRTRCIPPCCTP